MPSATRFTCSLTLADEPDCTDYARVTVVDAEGDRVRGCPRHAVAALDGTKGAHVDWDDSKGLNEYEVKALELSEERSNWQGVRGEAGTRQHQRRGREDHHGDAPGSGVAHSRSNAAYRL